jgi:uncharacterized OB-fold protein
MSYFRNRAAVAAAESLSDGGLVAFTGYKHVTESVVSEGGEVGIQLIGSCCEACGAVAFPARSSCSRCSGERTIEHLLSRTGTPWAFTIQGFPPKTPYLGADQEFEPFGVGYVNLADEVLVESRLVTTSPEQVRNGMVMRVVSTTFARGHQTLIEAGDTEIGGRLPIKTDGGCIANGEPIGACGLRRVYQSALQLRGEAYDRQVPASPGVAITHVHGAPGISSCTVLTS